MASQAPGYMMGHSDHERRRLALQALRLNPLTEGFLQRAGIGPGMNVLDLGCGVGEVSLIAARLVGPGGHVTGLDIDAGALEIATARASSEEIHHVTFRHESVTDHRCDRPYDAVVTRLFLVHTPDPLAILRHAIGMLRSGGIVAVQEYDFSVRPPNHVSKPLLEHVAQAITSLMMRITSQSDLGIRLYQLLQDAGLVSPEARGECVIEGGPDAVLYEWVAETVRSLLPHLERAGLATAAELDVETLAERLRAESVKLGGCLSSPLMIGVHARKP
ncbi:MAG TPA: class I SAM-dependent methyltransferase [Bryobacteraceae bacterium]|nr:class I SAM-dependent methyltransferase [Bryobacteraceae bacterium]